jgi:DNA-binding NarL/FixJ family response regulator
MELDVALIDVAPAGCLVTLGDITAGLPGVKSIALGILETEHQVIACAEAGVVAYVPRDGGLAQLVETLGRVVRDGALCSPSITGSLFRRLAALAERERRGVPSQPLTMREDEIARLISEGLSNREIGRRLYIELSTVKNHVHNILDKLQLRCRADAAAWFAAVGSRPPGGSTSGSGGPWRTASTPDKTLPTAARHLVRGSATEQGQMAMSKVGPA